MPYSNQTSRRRVVALAQVLTLIGLLVPGPMVPGQPAARAAIAPVEPEARTVFDASGNGVGCRSGTRRFRGPKLPKDPPWPPGTKPERTPEPSPEPSVAPSGEPSVPEPPPIEPTDVGSAQGTGAATSEATGVGGAPTMLLAAHDIRSAQVAEPGPDGSEPPAPSARPSPPAGSPAQPSAPPASAQPVPEATPPPGDDDAATDRGKRKRRGRNGLVRGIDVSHWQSRRSNGSLDPTRVVDFERVRKAGHRFVFLKATEDDAFIDPMFPTNVAHARAAGLAVGAYHVFDYTLDGRSQADHFLDRIEAFGAVEGALPPVIDVECFGYRGASIHALAETRLRDLVQRVYERTGRLPIIYTSVYMWTQVMGDAAGFEAHPLWAACWGCDMPPSLASGWDDWAFWQTGTGRVPGVGRLDANYFSGSVRDLKALELRPLTLDDDAFATRRRVVDVDLGGRDATHLRSSVDGLTWSDWTPVGSQARVRLAPEEGEQTILIQLRAGPGLHSPTFSDSIVHDRTGPQLDALSVRLAEGRLGARLDGSTPAGSPEVELTGVPVSVSWTARDTLAGVADTTLSIACGEGSDLQVVPSAAGPDEVDARVEATTLAPGADCDVRVVSEDAAGNSTGASIDGVRAAIVAASDGTPTARVEGLQVGVVARRGPNAGRALITLDGAALGEVDLYAPAATGPEVVLVADLPPGSPRTIAVEPHGTRHASSSGTNVVVEGFVTLDRVRPEDPEASPSPATRRAPDATGTPGLAG